MKGVVNPIIGQLSHIATGNETQTKINYLITYVTHLDPHKYDLIYDNISYFLNQYNQKIFGDAQKIILNFYKFKGSYVITIRNTCAQKI